MAATKRPVKSPDRSHHNSNPHPPPKGCAHAHTHAHTLAHRARMCTRTHAHMHSAPLSPPHLFLQWCRRTLTAPVTWLSASHTGTIAWYLSSPGRREGGEAQVQARACACCVYTNSIETVNSNSIELYLPASHRREASHAGALTGREGRRGAGMQCTAGATHQHCTAAQAGPRSQRADAVPPLLLCSASATTARALPPGVQGRSTSGGRDAAAERCVQTVLLFTV